MESLLGSPVQCGNAGSGLREEGGLPGNPHIPVWSSSMMCGSRLFSVSVRTLPDSLIRSLPQSSGSSHSNNVV